MAQLLDSLRILIESFIQSTGYIGIALIMFIENIFTPIPSEVIMPLAGFLVEDGQLTAWGVMLSSWAGVLAGALVVYLIGMWISEERLRSFIGKYGKWLGFKEADVDRAHRLFERYGSIMILVGRLIPFVRSVISLPAGIHRMNLPLFLLYTSIGTLIWNGLLMGAGYLLGENWRNVLGFVDQYQIVWWVVLGLLVTYWVFSRFIFNDDKQEQVET